MDGRDVQSDRHHSKDSTILQDPESVKLNANTFSLVPSGLARQILAAIIVLSERDRG